MGATTNKTDIRLSNENKGGLETVVTPIKKFKVEERAIRHRKKDSKIQQLGKINIIGIEYAEHSSFEEKQHFDKFLKPEKIISTVPFGKDLMITPKVPDNQINVKSYNVAATTSHELTNIWELQKIKPTFVCPTKTKEAQKQL